MYSSSNNNTQSTCFLPLKTASFFATHRQIFVCTCTVKENLLASAKWERQSPFWGVLPSTCFSSISLVRYNNVLLSLTHDEKKMLFVMYIFSCILTEIFPYYVCAMIWFTHLSCTTLVPFVRQGFGIWLWGFFAGFFRLFFYFFNFLRFYCWNWMIFFCEFKGWRWSVPFCYD